MIRKVCLDKAKHNDEMMKNLQEMRIDGEHCDFIIKVEGKQFHVHRNIISAGSEYFRAMLRHDTIENQRAEVEIKDLDYECVKSCIDYIYTAEFNVREDKMENLLHAAHMMQLKGFSDEVSNILEKSLDMEHFFSTRQTAKLFNLESLVSTCNEFENKNFLAISKQPGFLNEDKRHILDVIKSNKTTLSEKEKLQIAINWIVGKTDRRKDFLDFLKFIELSAILPEFLDNLMETDPLISNDFNLHKIFHRAYKQSLNHDSSKEKNEHDERLIIFDSKLGDLKSLNPDTNEVSMIFKARFRPLPLFTAVSLNSMIYILLYNQSVYRLNFGKRNAIWEKIKDTITDHGFFPPVVSSHDSLIVIGSSGIASGAIELHQTVSENWTRLKDKPKFVRNHTLISLGDSIYCAGGYNGGKEISNAFCKLDLITSKWTDLEPMRNKKANCTSAVVNNKIFIFGGYRDGNKLDEVECYEVLTSHWQTLSPMTRSISFGRALHFNSMIIVGGRGTDSDEFMKYDIANDQWHILAIKDTAPFKILDMIII